MTLLRGDVQSLGELQKAQDPRAGILIPPHTTLTRCTSLNPLPSKLTHNLDTPAQSTMPRGNDQQTKVHYKGKEDDFVIFVDSVEALQNWKKDSSIPLAQVVSGWKVFTTHK